MVVLSVAVCTKSGKTLVARQFLPITKLRIEGLLAAFPKLITGGSGQGADAAHTFIETDAVRYVYQPLDQLYILLITNKQSNIIEDLDTLRLFAKLIPDYCGQNTEEAVMKNVFSLVFAFDEVVSLGVKENVTLANIKTNLAMDSHEEKLQKIIMESKMTEAREQARQKAEQIEKQKAEMRSRMQAEGKLVGFGSSNYPGGGVGSDSYQSQPGSSSMGGGYSSPSSGSSNSGASTSASSAASKQPEAPKKPAGVVKGMSLGKPKKQDDFLSAIKKEEDVAMRAGPVPTRFTNAMAAASAAAADKEARRAADEKAKNRLHVAVEEKLTVIMDREGSVKKIDVNGSVRIVVNDPDDARIVVRTSGVSAKNTAVKCRLHPNLDTALFNSTGVLANKDTSRAYPTGSDGAPTVLKWKVATEDVPLNVNLWDNAEKGRSVVSVDFKAGGDNVAAGRAHPFTLTDVHIVIPCRSAQPPEVTSKDGHVAFDNKEKVLMWSLEEIGQNHRTGALEFSVPEMNGDSFFPLNIMFTSAQTYSGLHVLSVEQADDEKNAAWRGPFLAGVLSKFATVNTPNPLLSIIADYADLRKPVDFTTTASMTVDKFVIEAE